jgi:hypothetical protein
MSKTLNKRKHLILYLSGSFSILKINKSKKNADTSLFTVKNKLLGSYLLALRVNIQSKKGSQYRNLRDGRVCCLKASARTDEKPRAKGAVASLEGN